MGETTSEVTPANGFNCSGVQAAPAEGAEQAQASTTGEGTPSASEIRSGIEETRSHLSSTIEALQEKLNPGRIADQVKEQIREKATEAYDHAKSAAKEATIGKAEKIMSNMSEAVTNIGGRAGTAVSDTGSSVVQYVRKNPVPFALVGIGLGMLAMNKRRSSYGSYRPHGSNGESNSSLADRASDVFSGVAEPARGAATGVTDKARAAAGRTGNVVTSAAGTIRDAASNAADAARQQVSEVNDRARETTRVASERVRGTYQDNPMALGIAALAAGALVGMSVPSTRVESKYLGEARETFVDQAKSVAQDVVGKVQRVTEQAGETVKDAAQKEGLVAG
jgi:ElaB/YqjD/DUF883 family membrane-anchored ribosome-binding protein